MSGMSIKSGTMHSSQDDPGFGGCVSEENDDDDGKNIVKPTHHLYNKVQDQIDDQFKYTCVWRDMLASLNEKPDVRVKHGRSFTSGRKLVGDVKLYCETNQVFAPVTDAKAYAIAQTMLDMSDITTYHKHGRRRISGDHGGVQSSSTEESGEHLEKKDGKRTSAGLMHIPDTDHKFDVRKSYQFSPHPPDARQIRKFIGFLGEVLHDAKLNRDQLEYISPSAFANSLEYEETTRVLAKAILDYSAEIQAKAAKVSDEAPMFELVVSNGDVVRLEDLLRGSRAVVLNFVQPESEPCLEYMDRLQVASDVFAASHVELCNIISVAPVQTGVSLEEFSALTKQKLLIDYDFAVAKHFGAVWCFSTFPAARMFRRWVRVAHNHPECEMPTWLPVPATFIIGEDHKILYASVAPVSGGARLEADELVAAVQSVAHADRRNSTRSIGSATGVVKTLSRRVSSWIDVLK